MKKFICAIMAATMWCQTASAETIMILDNNGNFKQQIYAYPASGTPSQVVYTQPQVVVTQPVVQQEYVVVRETPRVRNYYYDAPATSFIAGLGGAIIGHAIFGHHHHHHGGGHHGGHHGGGHHHHR